MHQLLLAVSKHNCDIRRQKIMIIACHSCCLANKFQGQHIILLCPKANYDFFNLQEMLLSKQSDWQETSERTTD